MSADSICNEALEEAARVVDGYDEMGEWSNLARSIRALKRPAADGEREGRPDGWEWTHEHQAGLIQRDGWMCEAHPGMPNGHDAGCSGPGMPWMVEGRVAIERLQARSHQETEEPR